MPILDAALAFALTMLVVATVVTQILSGIRKVTGVRREEMRAMLEGFFEKELRPVVDRELARLSDRVGDAGRHALIKLPGGKDLLDVFPEGEGLVHVSTEELLERVKRTDLGNTLLTHLNDEANGVFNEVGRRWEEVGRQVSETFRANSRKATMIVAAVLALVVNIDSLHVLNSYLTNRNLTESVVAQLETITAEIPDSAQDAPVREQVERLTNAGFPIGMDQFPHACFGASADTNIDCRQRMTGWGWLGWFFGIVLTSLLAGLGAPFWYDAVTGVAKVAHQRRRG